MKMDKNEFLGSKNGPQSAHIYNRQIFSKIFLLVMFFLSSTLGFSQQINVSGVVLDEQSEPIIGAAVKVAGQATGTITDINGKYSLDVNSNGILEFSYVGYLSQKVQVKGQRKINITMREDVKTLNEVIVTGYGSVSKKNLTTSIAKVNADDVIKTATSNMSQMLMGRAAGLQATMSSAQPGGGINITIRGGSDPIYVVDGVVMPSSSLESASGGSTTVMPSSVNRSGLAGLNPDDIESIEVLKDASASIYGYGAANGVVLITTKKGKEGKLKITYDGAMSYTTNYKYLDMLDSQSYMNYANTFKRELYMYNNGMGIYGSKTYDNGCADAYSSSDISSATTTNWRDMILRNGSTSSHNITIQGGTSKLQYYLSGNYYYQKGSVQNSDMERFTLRSNIASQLTDFAKLTTTLNYNKNTNNNGSVGGSSNGRGSQADGSLAAAMAYLPTLPVYDSTGAYTCFLTIPNPVGMLDMTDKTLGEGFNMNFTLDIDIIKNLLKARGLFGYNRETSDRYVYIPTTTYYDQIIGQSRGSTQHAFRDNSTLEGMLMFNKEFNDLLNLDAVIGMGRYVNHTNGLGVTYTDINDVINYTDLSAATGTISPSSYKTSDEKRSQFARFSADFLDKYVIAGTLRRDGTDKFFKSKKYAWFPSVSLAWKIFNEKFMKNITWVNMLKLRASYGVTGNDNLGSSLYGAYGAYNNYVEFSNNTSKYVPIKLEGEDYPDVTWEKTVMKNIGLDFSIFRDRINGSFDYFQNDITNMLGYANSNGLSMFATYPINGAHLRRYGWDASITTKNIVSKDFTWNSTLTLSHYNSIWKERMPGYDYQEYQIQKNEPYNALYFYRTDGIVNADKTNMPSYQPTAYQQPGCPIIKDLNGDGQITVADVDCVNVVPSLYWGLDNNFTYKNWDLDIFMYSQLGLKKYNYINSWISPSELANQTSNESIYVKDVFSTDNPTGTKPGIAYYMASVNLPGNAGTDVGYENAWFIRVRNITLGYTFNQKNLGSLAKYVNSVRVYADLQNPFLITPFTCYDPEVYTGGSYKGGKAEYPMTRSYSLGLKFTF